MIFVYNVSKGVIAMNIKSSLVFAQDIRYVMGEKQAELTLEYCGYIQNSGIGDQQKDYHVHPIYEFHMVLKDEFQLMLEDGRCLDAKQGTFMIIPYGMRHRIVREGGHFSKLLISFKLDLEKGSGFYSYFERKLQTAAVYEMNDRMQLLAEAIVRQMLDQKQEYQSAVAMYACACIIEAAQIVVGEQKLQSDGKCFDERVEKAAEFIRAQLSEELNAQLVADHIAMSRRQLLRLFMKCYGCGIEEFIRRERVEAARTLLYETDLPIMEVAERLGFGGPSAFANFYKRYEGITPSEFRKTKYVTPD